MRFVECVDYGEVPTNSITGVASISLISPGQVQVALYQTRVLPDGSVERRIVEYQIWDKALWLDAGSIAREAREAIVRDLMPVCVPGGAISAVH